MFITKLKISSSLLTLTLLIMTGLSACSEKKSEQLGQQEKVAGMESETHTATQVVEKIRTLSQGLNKATQAGDAKAVAGYFVEDAFFKLPGMAPLKSKTQIEQVHAGMFEQGMRVRFDSEEITVSGQDAIELGSVDILAPDGSIASEAYYLTFWKLENGDWKIYRDVVSAMPVEKAEN